MYSITENIYYAQLSSAVLLLQSVPVSHRIIQGKDCVLSPYVPSSCGLPLPPTCLLVTVNEARSYFSFAIGVWTGLNSLMIGFNGKLLWTRLLTSGFYKGREYLDHISNYQLLYNIRTIKLIKWARRCTMTEPAIKQPLLVLDLFRR
jgi:hypothetical protein